MIALTPGLFELSTGELASFASPADLKMGPMPLAAVTAPRYIPDEQLCLSHPHTTVLRYTEPRSTLPSGVPLDTRAMPSVG